MTLQKTQKSRNVTTLPVKADIRNWMMNRLQAHGFTNSLSRMLVAQAAHETGNFSSKIFKENNNLFGMKLAKIRQTTALGEKYGHAYYATLEDSIKDFALYYAARKLLAAYGSVRSYIEAIHKKNYFEADKEQYITATEKFYNLYFA